MLLVVWNVVKNTKTAVNLLAKNNTTQLVRQRYFAKRYAFVGFLLDFVGQSVASADNKRKGGVGLF